MSTANLLTEFLKSTRPRALALQGGWGRGKTHFWKHLIRTTSGIHWETYSYVSMFGVNSLEELKLSIFEKGTTPGKAHLPDTVVSFDTEVSALPEVVRRSWKPLASHILKQSLPQVGNVSAIYSAFVFSQVRKRLICFDDLERRGAGLSIRDVLGLITLLCEERLCSVLLILNEETLSADDKQAWHDHREKVFNGEITYQPSTKDCMDLVFQAEGRNVWHDSAREVLTLLNVTNIRVLMRAREAIDDLFPEYGATVSAGTASYVARSLAVLTYCHNARGENAPTVEHALNHVHFLGALIDKDDNRTKQQRDWDDALRLVDYYPSDIDHVLAEMVRHGYPDREALAHEIEKRERIVGRTEIEAGFTAAWNAYHENWGDNSNEVIALFRSAFPPAAAIVSFADADATINLMRSLGEEELADQFIDFWIEARRGARRGQLSIRLSSLHRPVRDLKFRDSIAQAGLEERLKPSLAEAMETLASESGDTDFALEVVAHTDVSEIFNWARSTRGRTVSDAFKYVFETSDGRQQVVNARVNVRSVLNMFTTNSRIDALRVKSLGLVDDEPA